MKYLRAYSFHGVYGLVHTDQNTLAECRFCGDPDHFSIEISSGLFRCFKCERQGNLYVFLRYLWEHLLEDFWGEPEQGWKHLKALAHERGIHSRVLQEHGIVYDKDLNHWVMPIFAPNYNPDGSLNRASPRKIVNLKRWIEDNGKLKLFGTPTCSTHLYRLDRIVEFERVGTTHRCNMSDDSLVMDFGGHPIIDSSLKQPFRFICEGEWDALAMASHITGCRIIASPGADSFKRDWLDLTRSGSWLFLYDHDDAGYRGYATLAERLPNLSNHRFLIWDKSLPSGYDIRDLCRDLNDSDKILDYITSHLKRRT